MFSPDEYLFHFIVFFIILMAIPTFILCQFVTSPYGKHYTSATSGTTISPPIAWAFMESPTLWLTFLLFPLGKNHTNPLAFILISPFLFHYTNRTILYPLRLHFRTKTKSTNNFPLSIAITAFIFNLLNAYMQSRWVSHYANRSPPPTFQDSIFEHPKALSVKIQEMMGDMSRWVFLIVLCLLQKGQALWLTVPPVGTKCVSEELHTNVVVLADFYALPDDHNHPNPTISVKVSSPFGNTLYHKENMTHGQFAFTTTEAGNYLACFWVDDGHNTGGKSLNVGLDWKTGIAAKDWESVARKEKIEGIELELRKLEGAVEAIHENLIYLKSREAEMRSVSEITNTRVASFSLASLGVCVLASVLQILYLKRYFQKKKLI